MYNFYPHLRQHHYYYKRIRGWWALLNGFCPECQSLEIDNCQICRQNEMKLEGIYLADIYPPPKWIKNLWWKRFLFKLDKAR